MEPRPEAHLADVPERSALVPPDAPLSTASAIGEDPTAPRYRLEQVLGSGQVGQLFRASSCLDGGEVALKLVHQRWSDQPALRKRMQVEAHAARDVEHPNVTRVLDVGSHADGRLFVATEWVEGLPLNEVWRQARLTTRRILAALCQVLSALAEAHRRGVVHGDLKPENVLVIPSGEGQEHIKVTDFGLAQLIWTMQGDTAIRPSRYTAPEAHAGKRLDGRADVYAVGVLLRDAWTGSFGPPPDAEEARRPPSAGAPPMPVALKEICRRACAEDPDQRFPSPLAMARALRQTLELLGPRADLPIHTDGASSPPQPGQAAERITVPGDHLRSRTKLWLGLALLLSVCAALALYTVPRP